MPLANENQMAEQGGVTEPVRSHCHCEMTEAIKEEALPVPQIHKAPVSKLKYAIGVLSLVFVVIGWVGTNFLTNVHGSNCSTS